MEAAGTQATSQLNQELRTQNQELRTQSRISGQIPQGYHGGFEGSTSLPPPNQGFHSPSPHIFDSGLHPNDPRHSPHNFGAPQALRPGAGGPFNGGR